MFLGWGQIPEAKSSRFHLWKAALRKDKVILACTGAPHQTPNIIDSERLCDVPGLEEWDICKKCKKIESVE